MVVNQMKPQPQMIVTDGTDMLTSSLQCLVTHFMCVMKKVAGNRTLLTPLLALVEAQNVNVCNETTTCVCVCICVYVHYLMISLLVNSITKSNFTPRSSSIFKINCCIMYNKHYS